MSTTNRSSTFKLIHLLLKVSCRPQLYTTFMDFLLHKVFTNMNRNVNYRSPTAKTERYAQNSLLRKYTIERQSVVIEHNFAYVCRYALDVRCMCTVKAGHPDLIFYFLFRSVGAYSSHLQLPEHTGQDLHQWKSEQTRIWQRSLV